MIKLHELSFAYPQSNPIFDSFEWQVNAGTMWSVLGPSGCGKTTLLYLLAGLRSPSAGQVLINGEELHRPRPRTGLILQDYGLLPWADVWENAALGLRVRGFYGPDGTHAPRDEIIKRLHDHVDPWLDRLGLSVVARDYPGQISGGQRQRTAIARTLVMKPDLLLMDEPFASLDAPTRESLQNLILTLQQEETLTCVTVTHTIEEAVILGERILILGKGSNSQARIMENPQAQDPNFRDSPTYVSRVRELRLILEGLV